MKLPAPLVRMRSALAGTLALAVRLLHPLALRLGRFAHEVRARALLRGPIAPGVQFVGPVTVEGDGKVRIGAGTRIGRRVFFETYGEAYIEIGERVTINDGVTLVAYEGIVIGDHTMIGEYTSIRDANHGSAPGIPVHDQPHVAAGIAIGEDVWIGRGVFVGKGVTLGAGAIIGANSVVTRDIEAGAIAVGAPCRPVGTR